MSASRRRIHMVVALSLAATISTNLTGCYSDFVDRRPVTLSVNGNGGLLVALCVDSELSSFDLARRNVLSTNRKWSSVWKVDGAAQLPVGTVLSFAEPIDGMRGSAAAPPVVQDGDNFRVILVLDSDRTVVASFPNLTPTTLREGEWFYTDGQYESVPCDLDKRR